MEEIRQDFPILHEPTPGGGRLVYLDNAATSQKPRSVIDALQDYYETTNANVHRGVHVLAEKATQAYEDARIKVAEFIGAPDPRSVIFTRGTTEAINLVAWSWARPRLRPGDRIVVTRMEHHSNFVPWQAMARAAGAELVIADIRDDGTLDPDAFQRALDGPVKLVALAHVSNVLGTVNPVADLVARAREAGAVTVVDGAQGTPHVPVDVEAIGCDFYALSGHKMLGPTGSGALYGRLERLEAMEPFLYGGEMISKVHDDHSTWAEIPHKFEAGTPHIAGAIGLGEAVDYLRRLGPDRVHRWESDLATYTAARLREVPGVRVFGDLPERGGAVSFVTEGIHPHDLAQYLDQLGIAIRAGHLCAQPLLRRLGVTAVSRASVAFYNTAEEIGLLVDGLHRARSFFLRG